MSDNSQSIDVIIEDDSRECCDESYSKTIFIPDSDASCVSEVSKSCSPVPIGNKDISKSKTTRRKTGTRTTSSDTTDVSYLSTDDNSNNRTHKVHHRHNTTEEDIRESMTPQRCNTEEDIRESKSSRRIVIEEDSGGYMMLNRKTMEEDDHRDHSGSRYRIYRVIVNGSVSSITPKMVIMQKLTRSESRLQWYEFTGIVAANGIAYIQPNVELEGLPKSRLTYITRVVYNGVARDGVLEVNTASVNGIRFFFNIDMSGEQVQQGDSFTIDGSSFSWLI